MQISTDTFPDVVAYSAVYNKYGDASLLVLNTTLLKSYKTINIRTLLIAVNISISTQRRVVGALLLGLYKNIHK